MALGKIPAVWRRHRYPLSLHYQLSVLGISGEEQKKGWLQYSVGDAASYLAGTESVLEVFLPIAVSLFAELIGATLLEFFSLLFSLLLDQDCAVEKREGISSGCSWNKKWLWALQSRKWRSLKSLWFSDLIMFSFALYRKKKNVMGTGDAHCEWEAATGENLPLGRVYPELNTLPSNRNAWQWLLVLLLLLS